MRWKCRHSIDRAGENSKILLLLGRLPVASYPASFVVCKHFEPQMPPYPAKLGVGVFAGPQMPLALQMPCE